MNKIDTTQPFDRHDAASAASAPLSPLTDPAGAPAPVMELPFEPASPAIALSEFLTPASLAAPGDILGLVLRQCRARTTPSLAGAYICAAPGDALDENHQTHLPTGPQARPGANARLIAPAELPRPALIRCGGGLLHHALATPLPARLRAALGLPVTAGLDLHIGPVCARVTTPPPACRPLATLHASDAAPRPADILARDRSGFLAATPGGA